MLLYFNKATFCGGMSILETGRYHFETDTDIQKQISADDIGRPIYRSVSRAHSWSYKLNFGAINPNFLNLTMNNEKFWL